MNTKANVYEIIGGGSSRPWGERMTIEEIKEWRKEGGSPHVKANVIVDTLLAEVEKLHEEDELFAQTITGYVAKINDSRRDLHTKLAIATEALERIAQIQRLPSTTLENTIYRIARTALERIKE